MEQIVVPQFLDVEDTVIGKITIRQFVEMLVGGLLVFLFYRAFRFPVFLVLATITVGITAVIAFVRVNGQPFHFFMLNFIATLTNPNLKVWRRKVSTADVKKSLSGEEPIKIVSTTAPVRTVSASRLSELALIVDTGGLYHGESTNDKPTYGRS